MNRADLEQMVVVFNKRSPVKIRLDKDISGYRLATFKDGNYGRYVGPRSTLKTVSIFIQGMIETLDLMESVNTARS